MRGGGPGAAALSLSAAGGGGRGRARRLRSPRTPPHRRRRTHQRGSTDRWSRIVRAHPVGGSRIREDQGPGLAIGTAHEIPVAKSDHFGGAQLLATAESGNPIRIPDLSDHTKVANRQVHQLMCNLYTVGVQDYALNGVSISEPPD